MLHGHAKVIDKRNVRVDIYPYSENSDYSDTKPVLAIEQSSPDIREKFSLSSLQPGTYYVIVTDFKKQFEFEFSRAIDYITFA